MYRSRVNSAGGSRAGCVIVGGSCETLRVDLENRLIRYIGPVDPVRDEVAARQAIALYTTRPLDEEAFLPRQPACAAGQPHAQIACACGRTKAASLDDRVLHRPGQLVRRVACGDGVYADAPTRPVLARPDLLMGRDRRVLDLPRRCSRFF